MPTSNLAPKVTSYGDQYPPSRPGVIGYLVLAGATVGIVVALNWQALSRLFV